MTVPVLRWDGTGPEPAGAGRARTHTPAVLPTVKTGPTGLDDHYSPVA